MNTDHQKYDTEEAMSLILNLFFQQEKESFNIFLSKMLEGFVKWSKVSINMKSVFEDLALVNFPDEKITALKEILEQKQIEWKESEKSEKQSKVEKAKVPAIKNYPPEKLKANKKKWIKLIAASKLEEVIEEIFEFSEEIEDYHILKDVVLQSSRMTELKMQFNQNVLSDESYRIEKNKIISALIDMINKMK